MIDRRATRCTAALVALVAMLAILSGCSGTSSTEATDAIQATALSSITTTTRVSTTAATAITSSAPTTNANEASVAPITTSTIGQPNASVVSVVSSSTSKATVAPATKSSATTKARATTGATATTAASTISPSIGALPLGASVVTPIVNDASTAAAMLIEAERTIRDPAASGATLANAARQQQQLYRAIARRADWIDAVIAGTPEELRTAVRTNLDASTELGQLVKPQATLPAWRIVAPAPAEELLAAYRSSEATFGIPWPYLAAIHLVETRLGRIRGTSTAGAQGPMQFLPSTWARYGAGGNIEDTNDAIAGAARYLKASGGPKDMAKALFAYNHSQHYVRAVSDYAAVMTADEHAFRGYYEWQVYYRSVAGDLLLDVGYDAPPPEPAGG